MIRNLAKHQVSSYKTHLYSMQHAVYDVSHMPSFVNCLLCRQKEREQKEREVEQIELYDELLDKFCFGTSDAGVMKRVLSRL